ncbi:TonB family protein [Myxococcota bacterium]|nr:TonB family protein [Myxococcota bacterium]
MKGIAAAVSIALHAGLVLGLDHLPKVEPKRPTIVSVTVEPKRPPPAVEPAPEPKKEEPPPPPPPEVKPKLVKKRTVEKIVADEPKPAPKTETPPPEPPATPPQGFSVDMEATVSAGNVAVTAVEGGGNMFADPNDPSKKPGQKTTERPPPPPPETGRGRGTAETGAYQVTKMPEGPLGAEEPEYPEGARARGVEGQVVLHVLVGASGRVEDVKIVRRLDPELDRAALEMARVRWRFKPALAGDAAVPVWITVPVTFVLER